MTVLVEEREGIGYLTFNRPDKSNALTGDMLATIDSALDDFEHNDGVHAICFQGVGKGFCGGYDLSMDGDIGATRASAVDDWTRLRRNAERWERVFSYPKPTVARVHGYCLAAGFELAMTCDFVVAEETARLGHPAVRSLGVPPFQIFSQVLGHRGHREAMLTGRSYDGREAYRRGWITEAAPAGELDEAVERTLNDLRRMPVEMLVLQKAALLAGDKILGYPAVRGLGVEYDVIAHRSEASDDFWAFAEAHGLVAALQRRDAGFSS